MKTHNKIVKSQRQKKKLIIAREKTHHVESTSRLLSMNLAIQKRMEKYQYIQKGKGERNQRTLYKSNKTQKGRKKKPQEKKEIRPNKLIKCQQYSFLTDNFKHKWIKLPSRIF